MTKISSVSVAPHESVAVQVWNCVQKHPPVLIFPDRLTVAYRLSYQAKIAGKMPFYMLPYAIDSKSTKAGLGGAKNIRGVLRNRVVGDAVAFGNFELRSKFLKTVIFNQTADGWQNIFNTRMKNLIVEWAGRSK